MTLIDVLIVLLLIGALLRGLEEGLIHQLFSVIGFFGGLCIGALLEPRVIGLAQTPISRLMVTLSCTLGLALVFLFIGELLGILLKRKLRPAEVLNKADNLLGAAVACLALTALIWLSTTALTSLPYPALKSEIARSRIMGFLQDRLPPAPSLIGSLGHLIAPNGFPDVFIGSEPQPITASLPTPAQLAAAVAKDQRSVVKIEGRGCGGIVAGSGFVISPTEVATNAHVVAGIAAPQILDDSGTHRATVVWFDPDLDFAVLRTNHLAGAPLSFDTATKSHGTPGGVLGYPGGGNFEADSAAILDEFTAVGRNIYNQGRTSRDVYSIQAKIVPGNSGGPLVNTNGDVIGVVFATSTTYNNLGYALSLPAVLHEISQASANTSAVDTGGCAE